LRCRADAVRVGDHCQVAQWTPTPIVSIIAAVPFFFFTDPATAALYTLSLHDALPICAAHREDADAVSARLALGECGGPDEARRKDRKSTRLNSSHLVTSYAVFCLKKKNTFN